MLQIRSNTLVRFALAVVLQEIANGRTKMWPGVPCGVSILLFFVLMTIVGVLEGLQIALLAVIRMDLEAVRMPYPIAYTNSAHVMRASDLEAFLVGRQILVTLCMVRRSLANAVIDSSVVCRGTYCYRRCHS